jgi:membrane protease subunit HflK
LSVLVAAGEVFAWFGFIQVDGYLTRILTLVLGLAALETLVNLIFEIYRPRVRGQAVRLLYESRLIGLLSQPGGLITTAAQALDYQFGFKVSETWFYRFLEKAFAWLVLFQLGVLFLSTSVVVIEPSQQGLLERFGLPVKTRPVLNPGLHLKWPWPIDKVHRYPARAIQTIYIGFVADPQMEKERVVLWTRAHYKEEFNMLVASREQITETATNQVTGDQAVPVNLLTVSIPVQYRIRDLADWVYNNANSENVLEAIANREVVRYLVNVDIEDIMTDGRSKATQDLRQHIQARADESRLGVEILYLGLQGIHPPVSVAADYEAVIGALQEKETNILTAEAYALETVPRARAEATIIVNRAEIDRTNTIASAVAQSGRYLNQLEAFGASRTVYAQRTYLDTLARAVSKTRKLVLSTTNTQDVILLNLEDKLRPDLEDIPLNPAKK